MSELEDFAKDAGIDEDDITSLQDQVDDFQNENIDDEDNDIVDDDVIEDNPNPADEAMEKAQKLGWVPKDEWQGDPEDWTSPKRFLQTRDIIEANKSLRAEQDRMKNDFSRRLDNLQTFHEATLKSKIEALEKKRDEAVSEADVDTYNEVNKEIKDLEDAAPKNEPKPEIDKDAMIQRIASHQVTKDFVQENPWLIEQGAKGLYAQKVLGDWITQNVNNPNAILEDGFQLVKDSVAREFREVNPNRQRKNSMGDRGPGPKKKQSKHTLTMNDLTREEMGVWQSMGSSYKNQAEFLQTVADSRKGG